MSRNKIRGDDPKFSQPKERKKWGRKLHIDGQVWTWTTDGYSVYIRSPDDQKYTVRTGADDHDFAIRPSDVKHHIIRNIIGPAVPRPLEEHVFRG